MERFEENHVLLSYQALKFFECLLEKVLYIGNIANRIPERFLGSGELGCILKYLMIPSMSWK